ncbi:MAG TPA: Amuc_1100 family pilus-like protein [Candidatus Sulfotelmatobacter sp.]|nr:Amuc_1100 family pilus-like protein [Candidatus Sulfotelmatobacter sp.]
MGWIKRNLLFTIGGVIALALLGASIFYNYKSWRHNSDSWAALQSAYNELGNDYKQVPTPAQTNIDMARLQERQLRDWIALAHAHFVPVAPIPNPPNGVVTPTALSESLRRTIHDMQVQAVAANVEVPDDYSFSFVAERNLLTFSPGSLNALASHLGEVKAICDILFDAKINGIDNIQREMISENDNAGPQSDYLTERSRTVGDLAVITPYAVTFRCFSGDLGNVLAKMASSDHCFIVTGINVRPAAGVNAAQGQNPPPPPPNPEPNLPNGQLQTVLDEQLLSVTLGIEVVKLTK